MEIEAWKIKKGHIVVGKSGGEATVAEYTHMASGVLVSLDSEFGKVERVYRPDEIVTVK